MTQLDAVIDVPATAVQVWNDLVDIDLHEGFVDALHGARILSTQPDGRRVTAYSVDLGGTVIAWVAAEVVDDPRRRLSFAQLEGPFAVLEGRWIVEDRPAGSLVRLHLRVETDDEAASAALGSHLQRFFDGWLLAIGSWASMPPAPTAM